MKMRKPEEIQLISLILDNSESITAREEYRNLLDAAYSDLTDIVRNHKFNVENFLEDYAFKLNDELNGYGYNFDLHDNSDFWNYDLQKKIIAEYEKMLKPQCQ